MHLVRRDDTKRQLMITLGIDPGTATTGYGIIKHTKNQPELVDFGVVSTDKKLSDAERLEILADDIEQLIKKYKPEAVGVEKLFLTTNQKTVMTVSQARGVVLLVCQKHKLPIFEFTPLQVKNFICGYGKAEKKQVQYVVQQTFKLKAPPKPDDAADALAIAICAAHHYSKSLRLK
jgi:crossover junction endodeoxyribonuclease RuvC